MSEPTSTAEFYHEKTKYRAEALAGGPGLDWSRKPPVFKVYPGAETVVLSQYLRSKGRDSLFDHGSSVGKPVPDIEALARILFYTNGLTASAEAPGEPGGHTFFRAAPSAGALYPTELYVAVRSHPEVPTGVYNVSLRGHSLQRVAPPGFGPEGDELHRMLFDAVDGSAAVAEADVCILMSAVWFRSSWRYGPRGYRRCMLDSGHVLGNLVAYAPMEGFAAVPLGSFVDKEVADLLGIDPVAEGPLAVVPLVPADRSGGLVEATGPGLRSSPFAKRRQPDDDGLIGAMTAVTAIARDEVRMSRMQGASAASAMLRRSKYQFSPGVEFSERPPDLRGVLPMTIIRRRSTRAFAGTAVKLEDLARVLEYAYRADLVLDEWAVPGFFDPSLLETWVVAQNIDGLTPGVYLYVPESRELRLVDSGDFRRETHYLALGQDLAGMAGAVVFHTCDLPAAVRRWGDRAYRLMHMDAGHLGERMNLAAIALGLGVSGIGGFLDEEVNSLLGIPAQEACVYITCIGAPA